MSDELAFAWEPLSTLLDDGLERLVEAEYAEVSVKDPDMPLAVDWDKYHTLEAVGILRTMAARRGEELIGFNAFMVMPHMHYYKTPHALNDAIYVEQRERGIVGLRLILETERQMSRPMRFVYYSKDSVVFGKNSSTDGLDSMDVAQEAVDLMEEYGLDLPAGSLPESGTLGDLLAYLGYQRFETAYAKMVRA